MFLILVTYCSMLATRLIAPVVFGAKAFKGTIQTIALVCIIFKASLIAIERCTHVTYCYNNKIVTCLLKSRYCHVSADCLVTLSEKLFELSFSISMYTNVFENNQC